VAISAAPLLKVVPIDNLLARVDMPDADLAFVRPGQSAELEFPAYRRDKYGWLPAEVISIGTDALPPDETSELKVPRFPVKLKLARQYLEFDGQRFGLQAGMALTANLKLDKASILELLFNQFTGGARALRTIR
jgi:HlyD family secretion protein